MCVQFVLWQFGEKGGRQQAVELLLSSDTRSVLPSRQRRMLGSTMFLLGTTMLGMFCAGSVCAQERPRNNEYAVWYTKQFAPGHAFSETTDGRLYQIEGRYTRMLFARRLIAVRYVAEVVPWTVARDPHTPNGRLAYAHRAGVSCAARSGAPRWTGGKSTTTFPTLIWTTPIPEWPRICFS